MRNLDSAFLTKHDCYVIGFFRFEGGRGFDLRGIGRLRVYFDFFAAVECYVTVHKVESLCKTWPRPWSDYYGLAAKKRGYQERSQENYLKPQAVPEQSHLRENVGNELSHGICP